MKEKREETISKKGKIAQSASYREYVSDSLIGILRGVKLPEDFTGDYRELIREMREKDYEAQGMKWLEAIWEKD